MKVILIVVFSITIIKILPPLASVLRSPKVTGPGYRTSVLQLGPRNTNYVTDRHADDRRNFDANKKRSKVKEIIVLIKARSFLDELNLEHLTS